MDTKSERQPREVARRLRYPAAVSDSLRSVQGLIVVDMQAAFVSGEEAVPQAAGLLMTVADLIQRARETDALVVHLQNDRRGTGRRGAARHGVTGRRMGARRPDRHHPPRQRHPIRAAELT